jgi:RNA polymerase sigma-70 factor (ECF subfamily)
MSEATGREALARALAEEGDRLYGLALRVTRDPGLAADAVQEAFVSALEHFDEFRGESRLSTWLHRIVFTKSIDLLRRRKREEPLPETDLASTGEEAARGAGWARPPDEILLGAEARRALERAMGELTPALRAVFELREVEGRPTEEVAEILGIPPGTVRVQLHRARMRLRSLLGPHFRPVPR